MEFGLAVVGLEIGGLSVVSGLGWGSGFRSGIEVS